MHEGDDAGGEVEGMDEEDPAVNRRELWLLYAERGSRPATES